MFTVLINAQFKELIFRLVHYMWNESYGGFFREPHEEKKALTIDRKLMARIGSFQVLKCLFPPSLLCLIR